MTFPRSLHLVIAAAGLMLLSGCLPLRALIWVFSAAPSSEPSVALPPAPLAPPSNGGSGT